MADMYHIGLNKGDVPPYVLLPGDPARSQYISTFLDNPVHLATKREYTTYKGEYKGIPIAVTSTGIGGPSAAIAVEELAMIGAKTFIRVGTAGSISPKVKLEDIVLATAVVREEGTSRQYVPISYPAVANFFVVNELIDAAKKSDASFHVGIIHGKDAFYIEESDLIPDHQRINQKWGVWRKANVLCTSMESAPIFTIASIRNLRAGTVLAVIGDTYGGDPIVPEAIERSVDNAIKIALEGIVKLDEKDNQA